MRHTLRNAAFALTLSLALATQAFAVASGGAPRPSVDTVVDTVIETVAALVS